LDKYEYRRISCGVKKGRVKRLIGNSSKRILCMCMEEAWSSDSLQNVEISKDDDNEYDKYHTSNCRYLNE
jgi:hypothetical protein